MGYERAGAHHTMREVPSVLFGFMRDLLEQEGFDTRSAAEGLHLAGLEPRLGRRVDWDELATFLNRATAGISVDEALRLGEQYVKVNRYLRAFMSAAVDPRRLFHLAWVGARPAFPHMDLRVEDLQDGRLHLSARLPAAFQGCLFYFQGTAGELRAAPRLLRLPDATVVWDVGTHHGAYTVQLTEVDSVWQRVKRGLREGQGLVLDDLLALVDNAFRAGMPPSRSAHVRSLEELYGLTHAEARVASRVGRGLAVKEIAADLHISVETVRTHLKRIYAKTGTRRQAELVRLILEEGAPAGEP